MTYNKYEVQYIKEEKIEKVVVEMTQTELVMHIHYRKVCGYKLIEKNTKKVYERG